MPSPPPGLTEDVLWVVLVVQWQHVGELVLLVHQVQPLWDHWMIFETVFPDGEHHLDHVLDPLINGRLVEDVPETLKYGWKKKPAEFVGIFLIFGIFFVCDNWLN